MSVERIEQVRTALAATGRFESSSATLNRIHRNTAWAVQSNVHGIVTDTPVYEKNAWTGDAQLTAGTAALLFDTRAAAVEAVPRHGRRADAAGRAAAALPEQRRTTATLGKPSFKPADCCGATPAWDAFWFVIPWESYRRYGDRAALERPTR